MANKAKTPVENKEELNKEVEEPSKEVAKEEPVAKEEAPTKKPKLDPNECHDIVKSDNLEEVTEQIEIKRRGLLALFNKSKLISRILMIVIVAAVIGAIIMIFNDNQAVKIGGYCLAGAVLVAMLIYYIFTKDKFPKASREYIATVTDLINTYAFSDERFTELKVYPNKKLTKTELEVDRVYKNSSDIGSRNFISGKFDGHQFEVSENVLYSINPEKKNQRSVAFLGKYISIENNKKFEGRYIFNLKGANPEKLVDQPNDIDDLKVISEDDRLVVYSSNDKPVKDVFGTKFLSELKEFQTDERLLNFIIVVWSGHTGIYMSYDDAVTVLPFEHEFNKEAQDRYKADLVRALELATLKK